MLTGIGEFTNAATAPLYGADAHLDKPFGLNDIVEAAKAAFAHEFIEKLPKTDLHVHLDGSLRLDTVLDLAKERQIISQAEHDAMWEDNVVQWLCGDDEVAKEKLLNRILS